MLYYLFYMWNLTNKQTPQNQAHRFRDQTGGYNRQGMGMGEMEKKKKLTCVIPLSWLKIQHSEN